MLRLGNTHPYHWADKTMSVLRANQLEACEKDLAGLPFLCLFDGNCTDSDAESFYQMSYYPREDRGTRQVSLHTVEELRVRVLSGFAAELALLSPEEHDLLVRLVFFGGRLPLRKHENGGDKQKESFHHNVKSVIHAFQRYDVSLNNPPKDDRFRPNVPK